jgi:acyl carrier protein
MQTDKINAGNTDDASDRHLDDSELNGIAAGKESGILPGLNLSDLEDMDSLDLVEQVMAYEDAHGELSAEMRDKLEKAWKEHRKA